MTATDNKIMSRCRLLAHAGLSEAVLGTANSAASLNPPAGGPEAALLAAAHEFAAAARSYLGSIGTNA